MSKRTLISDAVYTQRSVYRVQYDLIWSTYHKHAIFKTHDLQHELHDSLLRIAKRHHVDLIASEIQADYVHLTLRFAPQLTPVNVIKALKGRSAYWFLRQHPKLHLDHVWAPTYYFGTGGVDDALLQRYLADPVLNRVD